MPYIMFENRTIFTRVVDKTIDTRAELAQYILNLSKISYGRAGLIILDNSLLDILRTFKIDVPQFGNKGLYQKLKNDGVFKDVGYFEDGEYSSINLEFITRHDILLFVENFIVWIEKNDKSEPRPNVEYIEEIKN